MVRERFAKPSGVKALGVRLPCPPPLRERKMKYVIISILILLSGCCNPEKPVVEIDHRSSTSLDVKGFDCDCDSDIDYWLHYKDGKPFGSKFYTEGNQEKCEKK